MKRYSDPREQKAAVHGRRDALTGLKSFDDYSGALLNAYSVGFTAGVESRMTAKRGPKPKDDATDLKRHLVTLDRLTVERAKEVGDGQLSLGLRRLAHTNG